MHWSLILALLILFCGSAWSALMLLTSPLSGRGKGESLVYFVCSTLLALIIAGRFTVMSPANRS